MATQMIKVGERVQVTGKNLTGTVKYVGSTMFASGKWIGVELDESKGKNDGEVQGKQYFTCPPNHGIFIRQSQLTVLSDADGSPSPPKLSKVPSAGIPRPSASRLPVMSTPSKESAKGKDQVLDEKGATSVSKIGRPTGAQSSPPEQKTKLQSSLQKPTAVRSISGSKVTIPPPSSLQSPVAQRQQQQQQGQQQELQQPPKQAKVQPISNSAMKDLTEAQEKCTEKERQIQDYQEKLATLKQKRLEDKAKMKELEKAKLQLGQLMAYKNKWQESQKDLQAQLKAAKKELQELQEVHEDQPDDLTSLLEAVEMATLDKEMAEEKLESLQQENETLKEKMEELTLDLEILRSEVSDGGIEGAATNAEIKALTEQNNRLKEAIVRLKDIQASEKNEQQKLLKQFKEMSNNLSAIQTDRDKLKQKLVDSEAMVDELQEQVDFAVGAEEMVETLTEKNLELGEKIDGLQETVEELEALQDLNEQLEESHNQTENDLREEVDLKENKVREMEKKLETSHESILDHQQTIEKFRELVTELQERITTLQDKDGDDVKIPVETLKMPEVINFRSQAVDTKAHAKAMDNDLRKFELKQCKEHLKMVESFLPESFVKRGGDSDGVLLLLLMPRLSFKADFLRNELRDKFDISACLEDSAEVTGTKGEQANFAANLMYTISTFQSYIKQFERGLSECSSGAFDRVANTFTELASHEKALDDLIDFLRKDQLDDTIPMGALKKAISNYAMMVRFHFSHEAVSCSDFLQDHLETLKSGSDAISIGLMKFKELGKNCDEGSELGSLVSDIELRNMEVRQLSRKIKHRGIPKDNSSTLALPEEVQDSLLGCLKAYDKTVQFVHEYICIVQEKAATLPDNEVLLSGQLEEMSQDVSILVFEDENALPKENISLAFNEVIGFLSTFLIKMQEGEYDCEPTSKPKIDLPYLARAKALRHELAQSGSVEEKLEAKESALHEVKKALKLKTEEVSQANIRVGLLEKRLDNSSKEADLRVEQVNKKLEQASASLEKKARDYEETMDALQADIDALEKEKLELKKRLDTLSKKTLLQDLARQTSGIGALVASAAGKSGQGSSKGTMDPSGEGGVQVVIKDSPVILRQLDSLKAALSYVKNENTRIKGEQLKARLRALPPIYLPPKLGSGQPLVCANAKRVEAMSKIAGFSKEVQSLLENINQLSATPSVVNLTKSKSARDTFKDVDRTATLKEFIKKKDELQKQVYQVIVSNYPGAYVESSFSSFVSPTFSKTLQEKIKPAVLGKITLPKRSDSDRTKYSVTLRPNEFKTIHDAFLNEITGLKC